MNQIVNMAMRLVMRKALSKGIDAGINKASSLHGARKKKPPQDDVDEFLNPAGQGNAKAGPTKEEVRAARRAKRQKDNQT